MSAKPLSYRRAVKKISSEGAPTTNTTSDKTNSDKTNSKQSSHIEVEHAKWLRKLTEATSTILEWASPAHDKKWNLQKSGTSASDHITLWTKDHTADIYKEEESLKNQLKPYRKTQQKYKLWKCVLKINSPIESVVAILTDILNARKWNTIMSDAAILTHIDSETDMVWYSSNAQAGGLIKARDFVAIRQTRKENDGSYVITSTGAIHRDKPPTSNYVRGWNGPGGFIIRDLGNQQSSITWILNAYTFIPSAIPDILIESTMCDVTVGLCKSLRTFVQSSAKNRLQPQQKLTAVPPATTTTMKNNTSNSSFSSSITPTSNNNNNNGANNTTNPIATATSTSITPSISIATVTSTSTAITATTITTTTTATTTPTNITSNVSTNNSNPAAALEPSTLVQQVLGDSLSITPHSSTIS
jgi:hypothetical protein